MSIGNSVGSLARDAAAGFSKFAREAASSANQMAGEAFTNPAKLIEDVRAGASYAITNKVYEFAASSSIILGAGITGLVLAKKAYSLDPKKYTVIKNVGGTTFYKFAYIRDSVLLGAAALLLLSAAAYETYARVSELRLTGRCVDYASLFEAAAGTDGSPARENNWHAYQNLNCASLTGLLFR